MVQFGIACYFMVLYELYCTSLYFMQLFDSIWYSVVLFGNVWYLLIQWGKLGYFMVLSSTYEILQHGIVRCCILLNVTLWYSLLLYIGCLIHWNYSLFHKYCVITAFSKWQAVKALAIIITKCQIIIEKDNVCFLYTPF